MNVLGWWRLPFTSTALCAEQTVWCRLWGLSSVRAACCHLKLWGHSHWRSHCFYGHCVRLHLHPTEDQENLSWVCWTARCWGRVATGGRCTGHARQPKSHWSCAKDEIDRYCTINQPGHSKWPWPDSYNSSNSLWRSLFCEETGDPWQS